MLQLDRDWRLRADSTCWMLEQKFVSAETGNVTWKIKGYYPLLEDALRGACNQMMKPTKDMADLFRKIDELHKMIHTVTAGINVPIPETNDDTDFLD